MRYRYQSYDEDFAVEVRETLEIFFDPPSTAEIFITDEPVEIISTIEAEHNLIRDTSKLLTAFIDKENKENEEEYVDFIDVTPIKNKISTEYSIIKKR